MRLVLVPSVLLAVVPAASSDVVCPSLSVSKPALTAACPAACGSGSLCVVFPASHSNKCVEVDCVVGNACACQCIPNPADRGLFITVTDDPTIRDDLLWNNINLHWRVASVAGVDAIAVDDSIATSWLGRLPAISGRLAIVGDEVANNFESDDLQSRVNPYYQDFDSLDKGAIAPFKLPQTLFEDVQDCAWLRIENLECPNGSTQSLVYPRLKELYLRNTKLTSFPLQNASFAVLDALDLSVNYITTITLSSLSDMLQFLNLSSNSIAQWTKDSFPSKLRVLDVSNNGIERIPSGVLPSRLQQLFLGDNALTKIPVDVASMRNLTLLWLKGNPLGDVEESALPPGGVESLDISNCSLTSVPKALKSMTRMTELWLSRNDLSRDPDLSMLPMSLRMLKLENCQLSLLSSALQNLTNLETLSLIGNPRAAHDLSAVPSSVTQIELDYNELDAVPARLKEIDLQFIYLKNNPLGRLAPGVFPSTLITLFMSNTTFLEIPKGTLPASIAQLGVSNCLLETLPRDVFAMQSLEYLEIRHCQLKSFDEPGHKWGLLTLFLNHNRITRFHGNFPSLRYVQLRNNSLEEFSMSGEPILEALDLAHNNLRSIPESVYAMSKLQHLNLTENPIRNVTLTADQLAVLARIPVLVVEQQMFQTDCNKANRRDLKGYSVCPTTGDASLEQTREGSASSIWGWLLPLVLGIAFVVAMVVIVCRRRHTLMIRGHQDYALMEEARMTKQQHNAGAVSIWLDDDLLKHRVNEDLVKRKRLLGSGMFGEVWLATYRSGPVALKKLKSSTAVDKPAIDDFVHEVKLLSMLTHPSVVRFVGVMWTKMSDIAMLTEYMDGGDLRSYLDKTPKVQDGWPVQMVQVAISITEAIVYLHSLDPIVIHRDLKSRNVLLDSAMNAKLSDFGISRDKRHDATMTAGVGTVRWVAPEVLAGQRYNESVDIYSLGVIFSEIDTHKLPFEDITDDGGDEHLLDSAIAGLIVTGALQVSCSRSCPPPIRSLIERCTAFEPAERPTGVQVAYELRHLLSETFRP